MLSPANFYWNLVDSKPLGDYTEDDIALGALPMHHIFGLVLLFSTIVLRHAIWITCPKDIPELLKTIDSQGITRMNGVPSLYLAMAAAKEGYSLDSLRVGYIGGGPVTKEQFLHIEKTLSMTLVPVYGMTEFIGISCASSHDPAEERAGGVGRPYSLNRCIIRKPDGTLAKTGEEGEICADGPARFCGYLGSSEPAAKYLCTGDVGVFDEKGVLHITGRIKGLIIRNGINLSPYRIEAELSGIQGVKAACVVGVDDPMSGEVPAALVVSDLREEVLLVKLSKRLAKNELPVRIFFTEKLPLTSSGKPDRQRIREDILSWMKS